MTDRQTDKRYTNNVNKCTTTFRIYEKIYKTVNSEEKVSVARLMFLGG